MSGKEIKENHQSGYTDIMKYLRMFGGAQGISMLLALIRNKLSSIILGTIGIGVVALFNRTIQMFSDCTNLSLSFSAVRKLSATHEEADNTETEYCVKVIRSIAFLTGMIGSILMLLFSPLLGLWMFESIGYYASRFALLSPVILFMAVAGGELAILRGVKQYPKVAMYTFGTAVASVVLAIPLYYWRGIGGIFPAIFLIALFQMVMLLHYSLQLYKYKIAPLSVKVLKDGMEMIKMGAGYIYASILASCAMWFICKFITEHGNAEMTGLFSVGFTLVTLLPGILFAALDSQYYPHLSGIFNRKEERNRFINEQVELQVLIQAPVLMTFSVLLPKLLPLLYNSDFMPAVTMTQIAMFGMFVRSMTYPISFIPLAKGDSLTFLLQESAYNILMVSLISFGFLQYGLKGTGIALAIIHTLDFLLIYSVAHCKYSFRLSSGAIKNFLLQLPLFLACTCITQQAESDFKYWAYNAMCILISLFISIYIISKHIHLLDILSKLFKRIKRQ